MDVIKKRIQYLKKQENPPFLQNEKLMETINVSKQALYQSQQEETLSQLEFFYIQSKFIKKRWWLLQTVVLVVLWINMFLSPKTTYFYRETGILIPLFAILIVPELWKNIRSRSLEIENSVYYSLRHIYAARLLIFGCVDLLLLSLFFLTTSLTFRITLYDMIIHFLIPFNMTCCICLSVLSMRRLASEYIVIGFGMIGAAVWNLLVINTGLYEMISTVLWIGILVLSMLYLGVLYKKLMKSCVEYQEVNISWN